MRNLAVLAYCLWRLIDFIHILLCFISCAYKKKSNNNNNNCCGSLRSNAIEGGIDREEEWLGEMQNAEVVCWWHLDRRGDTRVDIGDWYNNNNELALGRIVYNGYYADISTTGGGSTGPPIGRVVETGWRCRRSHLITYILMATELKLANPKNTATAVISFPEVVDDGSVFWGNVL